MQCRQCIAGGGFATKSRRSYCPRKADGFAAAFSGIANNSVVFSHEAKVGKISEEAIYYLMTKGLSEQDAKALIVRGFASPISKALPLEYAVEMNRLIDLELEEVKKDA